MSAQDGWDTTDLGKRGGESFSVDYDPARGVVRLSGQGVEAEEFPVDADRWEQQASRELAARGYGARWTQWEPGQNGTRVMSAARTEPADDDSWEQGAASYSGGAAEAPEAPAPDYQPPQYGRVRVYPQYTFPVYQTGPGGIGAEQEITVTDWDKQGRAWAEAEAKRQVAEALGAPSEDAPGGSWWMGRPVKDQFRWQPVKGTPRTAKPNDGLPEPAPWTPWRTSGTGTGTGTEAGTGTDAETAAWPPGEDRDISPAEYDRRVAAAEAAGTPYVLRPQDVQTGDRVADNAAGGELGTVREVTPEGGVQVEYDRELTPGHPGTKGVLVGGLEGGTLQRVPRDATYASLEERRPPAEQAERYAARQAHYAEQHGPGKRGKKGWTAHKRGCRVCSDIDAGGDGVGRRLVVKAPVSPVETDPSGATKRHLPEDDRWAVEMAGQPTMYADTEAQADTWVRQSRDGRPAPATAGGGGYPVRFVFEGDEGLEVRHWRFEDALAALTDHVGGWTIPEDGTGVLDTDAFIASLGGYVEGLAGVLGQLAEDFSSGETPIAPVVGETLADFAASLAVMAAEAAEVHEQWRTNPDNAHDLRRANGEIPGADLFNVAA